MRGVPFIQWLCAVAVFGAGLLGASAADPETGAVTAQSRTVTTHYRAYARVEPITALPLRAAQVGVVSGLSCVPGAAVHSGEVLARLSGPQILAQSTRDQAAVGNAQSRLAAAETTLAAQRRQLASHLSTNPSVAAAEGAVAAARAALEEARADQAAHRRLTALRAPTAGIVLGVVAADGEQVSAGQTVVTLQPAGRLWVRATYFGSDAAAIRPGMTGRFVPDGTGSSTTVKVDTVFGSLARDGGESVGLIAIAPAPGWLNGEYGSVTLDGPTRALVAVPTRALVLDRGSWWVLVHTAHGDRRQTVVPGPTRGWLTFLQHGLQPGAHVVVEDAYLRFHEGIARRYQPPN